MPNCRTCTFYCENKGVTPVRTKKGMTKPGGKYCEHQKVKHKLISNRAMGKYDYPDWCPLGEFTTCMQCGTRIRKEEGDYCSRCR